VALNWKQSTLVAASEGSEMMTSDLDASCQQLQHHNLENIIIIIISIIFLLK